MISDSNSYRKNEAAARAIEQHLGLEVPKPREPIDHYPRANGVKEERARRRFERLSVMTTSPVQTPSDRSRIIDPFSIFSAIDEARDLDDLKRKLAGRGIECKYCRSSDHAEPFGWRLRQMGPAGTWMKGSDVDPGLSLKNVCESIRNRQAVTNSQAPHELFVARNETLAAPLVRHEDTIVQVEAYRVVMVQSQKATVTLILQLPNHAVRAAICELINLLACRIERTCDMHRESLGLIKISKFESTLDISVCVALPALSRPDTGGSELPRFAEAYKVMRGVLHQIKTAIETGDMTLLPGIQVKDSEVQAALAEALRANDEYKRSAEENDQEDELPHERECPP